jgi:heat shock protein HtpX
MSESPKEGTFRERIAVNRRNSLLLIAAFIGFVAVFGYVIGWAWIGDPTGAIFGLVLAFAVGTISGLIT